MNIATKIKAGLLSKVPCINCKADCYIRDLRTKSTTLCQTCEHSGARAAFERRNYFKNSPATAEQRANAIGKDKTVRWGGKTGFFDPGKASR